MITHDVSPCWHWGHPNGKHGFEKPRDYKDGSGGWPRKMNPEFQLRDTSTQNGKMELGKDHALEVVKHPGSVLGLQKRQRKEGSRASPWTRLKLSPRDGGIWGEAERRDFWLSSLVARSPGLTSQL